MNRTGNQLGRLRLTAQHLEAADFERPEDVVRHLLAMQAQDYPGLLWSIGLRTKSCTQKDVEQAFIDKKIVRTWPMRGTLHVMHADDASWMVGLLAGRATAAAKGRRLSLGLTDAVMDEVEAITRTELKNGRIIRRDDLKQLLTHQISSLPIGNEQFGHILRNFGERGILCFGPHDGKQPTFVLMDDWLPQTPSKRRSEQLHELAVRYFTSHGPASLKDFAGWTGLTLTDSRLALESAQPELEFITVSDTTYYMKPSLEPAKSPHALLLPGFDEFLLGYKDRSAMLATEHSNKIVPGNNGMFLSTIVKDGQILGTWKKQLKRTGPVMDYHLFSGFKLNDRALSRPAQKYQTFLGL